MRNTTWLLIIMTVLAFALFCWGSWLQGQLEKTQQKFQTSEWCLRQFQNINIRDQETMKHLKEQLEKK